MNQLDHRSKAAALAILLILALPLSAMADQPVSGAGVTAPQLFGPQEGAQAGLWSWLRSVWAKEGCILDPDGKPACGPRSGSLVPTPPTSFADAGCIIDPSGGPCARR